MKKTLLLISIFSLAFLSGCFSAKPPVNTTANSSGASPLPSASVNTVTPNTADKTAVTDEYKDVQFPQCKILLTTLKKLTICKGLPED